MDENFIRRFAGLSTNSKKRKTKLIKKNGKLVKIDKSKEDKFKNVFDKYFPRQYHYAYNVAFKHLANKPKSEQIRELKRVLREYTRHIKNIEATKILETLKI